MIPLSSTVVEIFDVCFQTYRVFLVVHEIIYVLLAICGDSWEHLFDTKENKRNLSRKGNKIRKYLNAPLAENATF